MNLKQKRNAGKVVVGVAVLVAALLCVAVRHVWKQNTAPPHQPLPPIHAASTPAFNIRIDPATCADPKLRSDLEVVARDVVQVVRQRFAGTPPETCPIVLTRGLQPHVHPPRNGVFHIELALNFQHRDYARLTYELGHEMGHVMLGTRGYPCGVKEVLATASSHQVLDDLDAQWAIRPPYDNWQDFHAYFCQYRAQMEEHSLNALPAQVQKAVRQRRWDAITLYLRYHIPEMEADIDSKSSRHLQTLASILLRSTTLPWAEFAGAGAYLSYHSAAEAKAATGLPPTLLQAHKALWRLGREHSTLLCAAHFHLRPALQTGFLFQEGGEWVWLSECDAADAQTLLNQMAALKSSAIEMRPAS